MGSQGHASDRAGNESGWSETAKEGVERVRASVREAADNVRETASGQGGRALDEAADFIREQPLVTIAITGAICFAIGLLLGHRNAD
jgi:ElaB/YqjD/DUF883 family membrane-anchored ribosome-binding protein